MVQNHIILLIIVLHLLRLVNSSIFMSLYEQQIRIFIHLIKTQPDLFSEYRNELINLVD